MYVDLLFYVLHLFYLFQLFHLFHVLYLLFFVLQIVQEGQHWIIRNEHVHTYSRAHVDGPKLRNFHQKIVNAMRLPFDKKKDIPLIHCERLGHLNEKVVAKTQLLPYEVVDKSWILRNEKYHDTMVNCVRAQCQRPGTRNKKLRMELQATMKSGKLAVEQIKDCVKWMIQICVPVMLLSLLSLFFYERKRFFTKTHKMPYYKNIMDKNLGHVSWCYVPWDKVSVDILNDLRLWVGLPAEDYPTVIGPYYGELHMVSYMDSSYVFSIYLFISYVAYNLHVSSVSSVLCL